MPRVFHVKKARKDNPAVKKGQPYYHWQRYRSRKQYSTKPPTRSQLTSSGKLAQIYDAEDSVTALYIDTTEGVLAGSIENAKDTIESAAEEFRTVGEEYGESADNLEEYFSGSQQIDDIREKAEACETAADEAVNVVDSLQEAYDRLDDLGDKPTEENPTPFRDKPDLADFEANAGDDDDDTVQEKYDEALEEWQEAVSDAGDEWQTEYDDIANDAENALSEFEGPQF